MTHLQFGLPRVRHADAVEALRAAMAAMKAGAQSIYCGYCPLIAEALAREGVPVICHVGLIPPNATWTGGFRAGGKTVEQAKMTWQQVQDFETAGALPLKWKSSLKIIQLRSPNGSPC